MSAPLKRPVEAEIDAILSDLFDAQARRRVSDAWLTGWIVGDDAMELLVECDLIETGEVAP